VLDYRGRDLSRLLATLELEDQQLIDALGGRRRGALRESWERFTSASQATPGVAGECLCVHQPDWPARPAGWNGAPRLLHVAPDVERLRQALAAPTVAIAGSAAATDYGLELAANIARELTLSGVTVVSAFAAGVGSSALAGALASTPPAPSMQAPITQASPARAPGMPAREASPSRAFAIAVMAGGVDVCAPAGRRELYRALGAWGCLLAELPAGARPRRWCPAAQARTIAWLADVTIVVEADDKPRELLVANVAQMLGRRLAAIPGRVTSPRSRGANRLIVEGAQLIRDAADVLELLEPRREGERLLSGERPRKREAHAGGGQPLQRRLQLVLDRVGSGCDTLARLSAFGDAPAETMLALAELELLGLLARSDGGRYVPTGRRCDVRRRV
jgi:DNA processing protein